MWEIWDIYEGRKFTTSKESKGGGLERKGAVKASKQNAMRATLAKRARRADWIILNFSIL